MKNLRESMNRYNPAKWQAKRYELHRERFTKAQRSTLSFDPMDPPDAIEFKVLIQNDDHCDLSWYGEFTDKWESGAIEHSKRRGRGNRNALPYFMPMQTHEDHRSALHEMGYSKGMADYLANTYVERDYRRAYDYGNGWHMIGVTVHLHICGAYVDSQSLWGIESDSDQSFLDETADDLKWELSESVEDYIFGQMNRLELLKAISES